MTWLDQHLKYKPGMTVNFLDTEGRRSPVPQNEAQAALARSWGWTGGGPMNNWFTNV